eukprot:TRINITY_DN4976_c0_g1_i1.p1 TRINITY_DN4976_c0_g1~~TRINITY_DN4976_c0_g1_i1.p1  ORF type:complete len:1718 (+),score=463.27 TRINITY_DN4976_c0_g1_i1:200-5155(+)
MTRLAYCANVLFAVLPSVPSVYESVRALGHRIFALLPALQELEWLAARRGDAEAADIIEVTAELLLDAAGVCRDCAQPLSVTAAALMLRHAPLVQDMGAKLDWALGRLGWDGVSRMPRPLRGYGARGWYCDTRAAAAEAAGRLAAAPERLKLLCVAAPPGGGASAFAAAVAAGLRRLGHVDAIHSVRWAGAEPTMAKVLLARGRGGLLQRGAPRGQLSRSYAHCFENARACVLLSGLPESELPQQLLAGELPAAPALREAHCGLAGSAIQALLPALPPLSRSSRASRIVLIVAVSAGGSGSRGTAEGQPGADGAPAAAVLCSSCTPPPLCPAACAGLAARALPELLHSPTRTLGLRRNFVRLAEGRWQRLPLLVCAGAAAVRVAADASGAGIAAVVERVLSSPQCNGCGGGVGRRADGALRELLSLLPAAGGAAPAESTLAAAAAAFGGEPFSAHMLAAAQGTGVKQAATAARQLVSAGLVTTDRGEAPWGDTREWGPAEHAAEWGCSYRLRGGVVGFAERCLLPRAAELGIDCAQLRARTISLLCAEVWGAKEDADSGEQQSGLGRYLAALGPARRAIRAGLLDPDLPESCRPVAVDLLLTALSFEEGHLGGFAPTTVAVALAVARALSSRTAELRRPTPAPAPAPEHGLPSNAASAPPPAPAAAPSAATGEEETIVPLDSPRESGSRGPGGAGNDSSDDDPADYLGEGDGPMRGADHLLLRACGQLAARARGRRRGWWDDLLSALTGGTHSRNPQGGLSLAVRACSPTQAALLSAEAYDAAAGAFAKARSLQLRRLALTAARRALHTRRHLARCGDGAESGAVPGCELTAELPFAPSDAFAANVTAGLALSAGWTLQRPGFARAPLAPAWAEEQGRRAALGWAASLAAAARCAASTDDAPGAERLLRRLHRAVDSACGAQSGTFLRQRVLLLSAQMRRGYAAARQALDDATQALSSVRLLQPYSPGAVAGCLAEVARCNLAQGRYEDADLACTKALSLLQLGPGGAAPSGGEEGGWLRAGEAGELLRRVDAAYSAAEAPARSLAVSEVVLLGAEVLRLSGRPQLAAAVAARAREAVREAAGPNHPLACSALLALGDAHYDGAAARRELLSALRLYEEAESAACACYGTHDEAALTARVRQARVAVAMRDAIGADVLGRKVLYVLLGASEWQGGGCASITDPELEGEVEEDRVSLPPGGDSRSGRPRRSPLGADGGARWLRWWRGAAAAQVQCAYPQELLGQTLALLAEARRVMGDTGAAWELAMGTLAAERAASLPPPPAAATRPEVPLTPATPAILALLADVLSNRGQPQQAVEQLEEAVRVARCVYGHRHLRVADLLERLGALLLAHRRAPAAEEACREALELRRAFYARLAVPEGRLSAEGDDGSRDLGDGEGTVAAPGGADRPAHTAAGGAADAALPGALPVSDALAALSDAVLAQGRPGEALQLARQAAEIRRRVAGRESRPSADALLRCAKAQLQGGDPRAAESTMRAALPIALAACGAGDELLPRSQRLLAEALQRQGRHQEAGPLLEAALSRWQRDPCCSRLDIAEALNQLALNCYALRDLRGAHAFFETALHFRIDAGLAETDPLVYGTRDWILWTAHVHERPEQWAPPGHAGTAPTLSQNLLGAASRLLAGLGLARGPG